MRDDLDELERHSFSKAPRSIGIRLPAQKLTGHMMIVNPHQASPLPFRGGCDLIFKLRDAGMKLRDHTVARVAQGRAESGVRAGIHLRVLGDWLRLYLPPRLLARRLNAVLLKTQ